MRIWRDIPDSRFFRGLFSTNQANLSPQFAPSLVAICNLIDRYHNIQKDRLQNFPDRIFFLGLIAQKCNMEVRQGNLSTGGTNRLYQRSKGLGAGSYFDALSRRCMAKARYLFILKQYYEQGAGADEVINPLSLANALRKEQEKAEGGKLIGMASGPRMEAIDPIHRTWELDFSDEHFLWHGSGGDIMDEWFQKVFYHKYKEPLFVFMENSVYCMDRSNSRAFSNVIFGKGTTTPGRFYYLRIVEQKLYMAQYKSTDLTQLTWQVFDTTWITKQISNKGTMGFPLPTMAYNWTRQKELLAGVHNAADEKYYGKSEDFHHSSFTGGDLIRCAGMIGAKDGKVHWLDNNSGHYKPGTEQLHRLAKFLHKRGLFSPDARIQDRAAKGFPASSNDGIPADKYVQSPQWKPWMTATPRVIGGHRMIH
jgi:hypothetical protein